MRFLLFKVYAYKMPRTRFLGELGDAFLRGDYTTIKRIIWKTVRRNKGAFIVLGVDEIHDFYIVYYFPDGIYSGAEFITVTKTTLDAIKEVLENTKRMRLLQA